ncbi:MFS transporter [Amycolatopsis sp. NPDC005232]|uniref:CynX/NimT family MFS transporter n=1 Tax=Amycolatopsis sp. NPDC005232 TaxID=3157027 RepID=UPI0033B51DEA
MSTNPDAPGSSLATDVPGRPSGRPAGRWRIHKDRLERTSQLPSPAAKAVLFLAVGLALLALNLRPSIVAVSPILDTIRQDTGMSFALAGLLTTLPLLCFGLLAPVAPRLGRRFGIEPVAYAAMATIVVGTALRLVPSTASLLAGTVVIGAGIAVANVLLPGIIKRDFGSRVGLMTGLYSMSMSIGAALAAGLTVPIARATHTGWRTTLALWGLLAVVALIVWAPQVRRHTRQTAGEVNLAAHPVRGLWRHPVAWLVTAFMGLQSLGYYATTAYLPSILVTAGLSSGVAGWLLSLANLLGIAAAFAAPLLAVRGGRAGLLAVLVAVLTAGGLIGLIFAPAAGAYLWIVLLGFGQSAAFALALLFIVLRSPDGRHAAQLSSMAQSFGYLLAAAGPLALGAVHQLSNGWTVPIMVLLALLVPQTAAGLGAAGNRDVAESRAA